RLNELIAALHRRGIAYVDLEKRENILVGQSGEPWLIDFQISWRWPMDGRYTGLQRLVPPPLGRFILSKLQEGDRYHLAKHQRRHRPDLLTREQIEATYRKNPFIQLHRTVARPLTLLRRRILKALTGRSRSPKQDGPEFLSP